MIIDPCAALESAAKQVVGRGCRRATKYLAPNYIVRVTRVRQCGRVPKPHAGFDLRVWIGRPNHAERKFIKDAKRAGEPFPIKKIQLGWPRK